MEKVTIQLEEATVKALDRLMELRGCGLTIEAEVNVLVLASLGRGLCDMDDEFVGSELEEEMRATIKRLDSDDNFIGSDLEKELKEAYVNFYPPSSKDRKFIENINKIETLQRKLNNSKTKEEKREIIKEMRDFVTNMEVSDEEDRKVKQDMLSFVEFIESTTEEIHNEE